MATTPDVLVDRYEVGRLLGAGGMAEVYEGHDRLLARRVAIKVLLSQFARDPSFLTRFKREAQSAASLTHPNIVAVYDTGVQAGTNFIVMEYVEGRTLRDVIRSEGPLLPERAAEVAADVCGALAAAHARGIIHRDIKPANIMITTDGQVKVMDFGIARAVTSESITQTAAVVGTAQYISPEQAQATGVDARSDLYSLGTCLYEMLSGRVPFTGNTPVAIAYQHVRDNPPPLRSLNPDVPPTIEAVTMKAMAKNPDNRYQTAMEMREDLLRVRAGQNVMATPLLGDQATVVNAPRTGQYEPQGTSVLAGPMTSTGGPPYDDPYEGRAARNAGKGRRRTGWILIVVAIFLLAAAGGAYYVSQQNKDQNTGTTAAPVAVIDVQGLSREAATQRLEGQGLNVVVQQERSDEVDEGNAIRTDPAAGDSVPAGSQVTLFISTGRGNVPVPNFIGMTLDQARAAAKNVGLDVRNDVKQPSERFPAGQIYAQNPNPDVKVEAGTEVRVSVSTGPPETTSAPTTTSPPPTTTTPPTTDTTEPPDTTDSGDG
jgi:serine/threonine-protein kinase